jgi:hypothetical protein
MMLLMEIDFALSPYRNLLIILNFLIIYNSVQLGILFLINSFRNKKSALGRIHLSFTILILGSAIVGIIVLLKRFFNVDYGWIQQAIYISASVMFFIFISNIEQYYVKEKKIKSHYFFTIMSGILIPLAALITPDSPHIFILFVFGVVALIFPILFIVYLIKNSTSYKNRMIILLICVLILYVGIGTSMERALEFLPSEEYLIAGMIAMIIALNGAYFTFYKIDIFIESGWQNFIEEYYIIRKQTHQPVYYLNLKLDQDGIKFSRLESKKISEQQKFFSGGIIGIDEITKSISESKATKGINLIKQEDKFIMMEHSKNYIFLFVANKNLSSLRYYLQQIKTQFEKFYGEAIDILSQALSDEELQNNLFVTMDSIVKNILID